MELKEKILQDYKRIEFQFEHLKSIKEKAKKHFENTGFPNRNMEEWRFTNLKPILSSEYEILLPEDDVDFTEKDLQKFHLPEISANLLVLINGKYSKKLSKIITKENTLIVESFFEYLLKNPAVISKHFSKYADFTNDGFTALNTAYCYDGVVIEVKDNTYIQEPFIILNISDSRKQSIIFQPRNLFLAGKNSRAILAEMYFSTGNKNGFSNSVTEIFSDENSELYYYKIQNESDEHYHVGTTQIKQEKNSRFHSVTAIFGGGVIRNNLNSYLGGEGIECDMKGIYFTKNKQFVDNHTLVDHAYPNSYSNELYKGIIDDESDVVFNGKIMVRKDAQKTNAYQMNKNILLTNRASVNSKPQLEIFADDVKCSHGATTGQIDKEQLFYLRSRGIGKKTAERVLLYAFANEVLEEIKIEPLKIYLERLLEDKLNDKTH